MRAVVAALVLATSAIAAPAFAQKEIPKAPGHDQCPLGYVNTLGTTCVSPIYYEVAPTNGEACKEGWMNIGAGYCKKKKALSESSDQSSDLHRRQSGAMSKGNDLHSWHEGLRRPMGETL